MLPVVPQSAETAVTVAATWFTVTVNCTLVEFTPPVTPALLSVTVTVIVAVPKLFAAGVKVSVPVEFGLV